MVSVDGVQYTVGKFTVLIVQRNIPFWRRNIPVLVVNINYAGK